MTALDTRSASPVAGTVTLSTRSIERSALAVVHEELGVEVSAVRVRLSDDHGGLALDVSAPVVVEPGVVPAGGPLIQRLHQDRARIAARLEAVTGRRVTRIDIRVTGTRTQSTRRVA